MRLRSRGLGRKELVMDFREYAVIREGDEIVVVGTIRDPVNWDFAIRICEDDLVGMTKLILNKATVGMLLRSLFRRHKKHHWSHEWREHIAEGRSRLEGAREKATERIRGYEASGGQLPKDASPRRGRTPAESTS